MSSSNPPYFNCWFIKWWQEIFTFAKMTQYLKWPIYLLSNLPLCLFLSCEIRKKYLSTNFNNTWLSMSKVILKLLLLLCFRNLNLSFLHKLLALSRELLNNCNWYFLRLLPLLLLFFRTAISTFTSIGWYAQHQREVQKEYMLTHAVIYCRQIIICLCTHPRFLSPQQIG